MNSTDIEPTGPDSEEDHIVECKDFSKLPLHVSLLNGIEKAGFEQCTPIQAKVLPYSLEGQDIVGKAQTGTGKTAAFLLTLLNRLLKENDLGKEKRRDSLFSPRALILAPTRELVLQICQEGELLGKFSGKMFVSLIGGMDYQEQFRSISKNPDVIVATPGRLIDLFKNRKIGFSKTFLCVIDEADRMFDMGFYPDLKYILRKMPSFRHRQTLLFSATMSYRVTELSYEFMNHPIEIDVSPTKITVEEVSESVYHVGLEEKLPLLLGLFRKEGIQKAIIFCNTKSGCEWLGFKLKRNEISAEVLTGDISQSQRFKIVRRFKEGQTKILVATDVASRGLHVDDLSHVINYDVPEDPENYVHRIGRTARAGRKGCALTLACERFVPSLPQVEDLIGHKILVESFTDEDLVRDQAGPYRKSFHSRKRPEGEYSRRRESPANKRGRRRHHGRK